MRRRLLTLVFSTTLVALVLLGVILVTIMSSLMHTTNEQRVAATARVAAFAIHQQVELGGFATAETLRQFVREDAVLEARLPDGRLLRTGPLPEGASYRVTVDDGGVAITATVPASADARRLALAGLLVVGVALVALGFSMLVASFYAKRITRPLEDFAELAERISTGDPREASRRYGVPELDAVAEVLERGVMNFNALLENERRVTTEASHQLRTPLTALSLRLEEILAADELDVVRHEANAALGQVERLSGVVDEVVATSRGGRGTPIELFPVDRLVDTQIIEWTPAFEAAGRSVTREGATGMLVEASRGAQAQALATLIENSLAHGEGITTVRVREASSWVVLEVADEGRGVRSDLEARVFERSISGGESTGLGLALARTLVAADGGRLEMLSARPAIFAIFLPARPVLALGLEKRRVDPRATGPDESAAERRSDGLDGLGRRADDQLIGRHAVVSADSLAEEPEGFPTWRSRWSRRGGRPYGN